MAVDEAGMDVCATNGESGLNSGRIIRLLGRQDPFLRITFVQYLTAFISRPEVTSDVISGGFWNQ